MKMLVCIQAMNSSFETTWFFFGIQFKTKSAYFKSLFVDVTREQVSYTPNVVKDD